ncbi:MAG: hypothetical protein C4589_03405 [Peptococcaceae bacterium]|nr:MAG: hypothetical protein C4589_03405 [Peptococcaceae bacterium]
MEKIIFVHGVGHDYPVDYWKPWAAAVRKELFDIGLDLPEEAFEGIGYADIFPELIEEYKALDEKKEAFLKDLWSRVNKMGTRGLLGDLARSVVSDFGQIFYYFYVDQIFARVNGRVYEKLQALPATRLIGYSLGSVVCYCALHNQPELARKVRQLLLLGSPMFWFAGEIKRKADMETKLLTRYFSNVAGRLDIAWPQMVPRVIGGLDDHIDFLIHPFNPIKGHRSYFTNCNSVKVIAGLLKKRWQ